jgi:hypothetical protein
MWKYLIYKIGRETYDYKPIVIQYDQHTFYGMYAKYNYKSGFCCIKKILFRVTATSFDEAYKLLEEEYFNQINLGNIKENKYWNGPKPVNFIPEDDTIIEQ